MNPSSKIMGSLSAPLWIVSPCPKQGDKSGPLSTTSGAQLIQQLYKNDICLTDIRFDYMWYSTTGNAGLKDVDEGALRQSIHELEQRIKEAKPNLVLFLGQECLNEFQQKGKLINFAGHILWNDRLDCKTIHTFDPYMAHKQKFVSREDRKASKAKGDKPGQYVLLLNNHLRKVFAEWKTREMHHFKYRIITAPSFTQAREYLINMLNNAEYVSYDIEVPQPYDGRVIDCIGLAYKWDEGISIPFFTTSPDGSLHRYFQNESEFHEIWLLVKKVLESNIPKVAQNSQFDTTMLQAYWGISTNNLVWDTMIAAHNLYCDLPKDLGTLIMLYTNLPYHKQMIHSSSVQDRWHYNGADAVANLHIMSGEIKEYVNMENGVDSCSCTKDNCKEFCTICQSFYRTEAGRHYLTVTNPSISSCIDMHIRGVRVDLAMRERVLKEETVYMDSLFCAMDEALPMKLSTKIDTHKINMNSSSQKLDLFYSLLNCVPVYKDYNLSADKKALRQFLEADKRDYIQILAKAFLAFSKSRASLLKFMVEPHNGYIRTKYDVAGTDTGRLASGENEMENERGTVVKSPIIPGETNLQNVAKGLQRQMLIPEEDEEFALVDLYAAEAYLNALDAGELEMLRIISGTDCTDVERVGKFRIMTAERAEDYKIHNWMQNVTKEKFPEECAKYNYTYKLAKQSIHGLNYGVMPGKMSQESGLPIAVTEWQYQMYHTKFPGIQERMKRIDTQMRQQVRFLSTSLGRRRIFIQDFCKDLQNQAYAWQNQSTIGEVNLVAINYLYLMSELHRQSSGVLGVYARPNLNTHDGIAIKIKKGAREQVIPYILNAFNVPLTLRGITIVIPISIGWGKNFNDTEGEKVYFYE